MANICFLFNHDQPHQVAHSLPIALALARTGTVGITLATTHPRLEAEIRRIAGNDLALMELVRLDITSPLSRAVVAGLDRLLPVRKLAIYRDNLDFFRKFDAIVVSEKSSLLLKTRYGLDTKLIHTRHGAGDRAIGFNRESALFDLVLVAGPKIRDRLIRDADVAPDRIAIVGYSKFDIVADTPRPRLPVQGNGRPTVLYNPHPSPHLSSWYAMGEAVLEQFRQSDRYNLIFAPHVMLFQRKWAVTIDKLSVARVRPPNPHYRDAPNMLIDLGSPRSIDMTYTRAADIYIGDVSSQIYEFLIAQRPCLFLDAHGTDWRGNPDYTHWQAGPVSTSADDIIAQVDAAVASHPDYLSTQRTLLAATFDLADTPSSQRAARAIIDVINN